MSNYRTPVYRADRLARRFLTGCNAARAVLSRQMRLLALGIAPSATAPRGSDSHFRKTC
ncbi:MAG: hypothetical protein ABSB42_20000 [Tepidisphaeraceae bacterium]